MFMLTKTIEISENTYKRLSNLKSENESFDDIITKLLDFMEKNKEFLTEEQ